MLWKRKITRIVVFLKLRCIPGSRLITFLASGKVQEEITLRYMTSVSLNKGHGNHIFINNSIASVFNHNFLRDWYQNPLAIKMHVRD